MRKYYGYVRIDSDSENKKKIINVIKHLFKKVGYNTEWHKGKDLVFISIGENGDFMFFFTNMMTVNDDITDIIVEPNFEVDIVYTEYDDEHNEPVYRACIEINHEAGKKWNKSQWEIEKKKIFEPSKSFVSTAIPFDPDEDDYLPSEAGTSEIAYTKYLENHMREHPEHDIKTAERAVLYNCPYVVPISTRYRILAEMMIEELNISDSSKRYPLFREVDNDIIQVKARKVYAVEVYKKGIKQNTFFTPFTKEDLEDIINSIVMIRDY